MLPKDAAAALGIAKPTLRKWAAEFAPWLSVEAGQPIAGQDRRYSERDIALLQQVKSALAQRYSYEQIREHLGDAAERPTPSDDAPAHERSATAPGEQVVIVGERPEVDALRSLLAAQSGTLDAQRATLEAQSQLIAQLQHQVMVEQEHTEQTRADLVGQLADVRGQVLKVPRWLRILLGIEV
jgi:DNA-binding transcriptional MerR regulator